MMKVKLKSIKKVSVEKTQCIKLSTEDGLYITNNNIITHNTTATMISNLYAATNFSLMRNPPKYFGGAQSSTYVLALAAWSDKKAMQIYGGPLMQILETSPYFVKVRTRSEMKELNDLMKEGRETPYGNDCLPYTTSAGAGSICQFAGNLNMVPMSDVGGQMSLNIMHASFSELTFFATQPGWNDKKVWQFYKKTCDRIDSRMKGGFFGRAQPLDSKVLLYDGTWSCIGDIRIGDLVATPNEGPQLVIDKTDPVIQDCYEIEFDDGRKVKCSPDHLWKVSVDNKKTWQVVTLKYIIDNPDIDFEFFE